MQRARSPRKRARRKTTESSDPPEDVDESDPEVELDSLGSFFIHLIDNNYSQDDAAASHADHVEVISLSSNSDLVPVQSFCRAVQKVKYSHPLAYLDPKFSSKTQQAEERRTTRHSGQQITSSGLPDTPTRKRRPEVICSPEKLYPLKGFFRFPLNPSDPNYQVSSNSSGGSSTTQLPPLKTMLGKRIVFHFVSSCVGLSY